MARERKENCSIEGTKELRTATKGRKKRGMG